ncbi:MAG: hypothetical protein AAFY71_21235 [Bacteroidota bacterium]
MRPLIILSLFLGSWQISLSQHLNEQHSSPHHAVEHGIWEIITTGLYAFPFSEEEGLGGGEAHLTYWFDHNWGTGLSYTIKSENGEAVQDLALLGSWNPKRWLTLNIGPSFGFANEHRDFTLTGYFEAEINVRVSESFHFGPVFGSLIGRHSEVSAGFHLGFEFPDPLRNRDSSHSSSH